MLRTIYLHGPYKDLHPEPITVYGETVAEAVRSLENILSVDSPIPVNIDGVSSDTHLFGKNDLTELHLRPPQGGGGGRNGIMQILIGVALVAVSFLVPPAGLLTVGGQALITSAGLFSSGLMMALGGVLAMLAPTPEDNETEPSNYLAASENTVKIGTTIPIIYGSRRWGGHFLSFDVDTKKVVSTDLSEGTEVEAGDGINVVYDTLFLADDLRPIRPVFASATTGPSNIPTSDWSN